MIPTITTSSHSLAETERLAADLARVLNVPIVIRLDGTLGAGKTQFVKGLATAFGAASEEITSPTFVLIHRYLTKPTVYHLDAYRVADDDEFLELGIEEIFDEEAVVVIEWGEKFVDLLPRDHLAIEIDVQGESLRLFQLTANGPKSESILSRLVELRESRQ
jgi:tRNA threonylcarbamoyladenosine biosynthesis protein TsaE